MKLLCLLALCLTGCVGAGTDVQYNAETHEFTFERSWLGGPFHAEADVELPDGTKLHILVESDNDLDPAVTARAKDQETIQALAEKVVGLAGP